MSHRRVEVLTDECLPNRYRAGYFVEARYGLKVVVGHFWQAEGRYGNWTDLRPMSPEHARAVAAELMRAADYMEGAQP